MAPTSHVDSAEVYAFPSGARVAAAMRKVADDMKAVGAEKLPLGTGWYHEAAMAEAKRDLKPRELPWWAEAEHESSAKNTVRAIF